MARGLIAGLCLLAGVASARAQCPPRSTPADHVFAGGLCLALNTFGADEAGPSPTLVVVVHGDISDGGAATYHAAFARALARPGVVAVALMRPGYADAEGNASEGSMLGREDNYTPAAIAAVGGAVDALKKHYRARRVIYVGHSGGAAIGGVLIAERPGLVDTAVLVSCPCDIPAWLHAHGRRPWSRSLSPSWFVHRVPGATAVVAVTGAQDDNTPPALAERYVGELRRRNVNARFVLLEGAGHGFAGLRAPLGALLASMLEP
ncbi:MAG: alpha/beta hydrolase [Variibacter sp.]|nr:alpha/beta hydrolase [Variibacter sp.]